MSDGSRIEAVAQARLRDEVPRRGRVRLELATQLGDVDPEVVRLLLVARPPDVAQELLLRDEPTDVAGEDLEQVVLRGSEADLRTLSRHHTRGEVHRERSGLDRRRGVAAGACAAVFAIFALSLELLVGVTGLVGYGIRFWLR